MESNTIARSYAEGVYALAEKHGIHDEFLRAFAALDVILSERMARVFLESPRIDAPLKKQVLRAALSDRVQPLFLNFVLLVLDKRRQRLYGAIAHEYRALVDEAAGRLHVQVTVARDPSPEMEADIRARLSEIFGKTVIAHVSVDEKILGGIVVRHGDRVIDGSLRRRLIGLRRWLLART
ncbi:MAG: ATP synthase F1 subunit delta [Gemmatimonadota bacterium]